MQFTRQETKLVERLRKAERQWPYLRWFMLAMGIFCTLLCAAWGYIFYRLVHEGIGGQLDSFAAFVIALEWTKCCMFFVLGTWFIVEASTKWHGDANRMLLLKLLDSQQDQRATEPNER